MKPVRELRTQADVASWLAAGLALRTTKQNEAAKREFEITLQLNPKHARARGNLGLVLAEQGNLSAAAQQFQMALDLNPQDTIASDMLRQIGQAMKNAPPQ